MLKLLPKMFLLVILSFSLNINAQIKVDAKSVFNDSYISNNIPNIEVAVPKYMNVDSKVKNGYYSKLKIIKYAHLLKLNVNIKSKAICDTIDNKTIVWRLKLHSKDAFSLGINFSKFKIPEDANLFIYNKYKKLGSYTKINNKSYQGFSVEPIPGDYMIIEYSEPLHPEFKGILVIDELIHDYLGVFKYIDLLKKTKSLSADCNVNVNCSQGDDWQDEKRSVCRILVNGVLGTGALINNTKNDGRAYLLTAHHVLSTDDQAARAVFYFNYENETCSIDSEIKQSNSISGSKLRATNENIDFALLELSVVPPSDFTPYYAGWDRSDDTPLNTTSIHHPQGDPKKISVDYDKPVMGIFEDPYTDFLPGSHWQILSWDIGTTEGGSSGAPLFNQNHLIVGDLTGGEATCGSSINDYYTKFSFSWDFSEDKAKQLKFWLDPTDSGLKTLQAYEPGVIKTSSESACVNETLTVHIQKMANDKSCKWTFDDSANIKTAEGFSPVDVSYSSVGQKVIMASVTTKNGVRNMRKLIDVYSSAVANFDYVIKNKTLTLTNTSTNSLNYIWFVDGDELSDNKNYSTELGNTGTYKIKLEASNSCSISEKIISLKMSYHHNISIYPNPSKGDFTVDFTKLDFGNMQWLLVNSKGSIVASENIKNTDSMLKRKYLNLSAGVYIIKMIIDKQTIVKKIVIL